MKGLFFRKTLPSRRRKRWDRMERSYSLGKHMSSDRGRSLSARITASNLGKGKLKRKIGEFFHT